MNVYANQVTQGSGCLGQVHAKECEQNRTGLNWAEAGWGAYV